ncbi:hypothetical protein EI94DRAFT_1747884 [Lactarius quietus]|nr:hypothetical protein EI94DRAFT_1747884 [Lactarius quietus]
MIWLNMTSTLGALALDLALGGGCGTKRREKDMMAQKKRWTRRKRTRIVIISSRERVFWIRLPSARAPSLHPTRHLGNRGAFFVDGCSRGRFDKKMSFDRP